MYRIRIERTVAQPISVVFEALSDHQNYARFPMINESVLLQPGEQQANGNGALRLIRSGNFVVKERIYDVLADSQICYQIEYSKPIPMGHQLGKISMEAIDATHTRVVWISEGHVSWPVIGWLMDKQIEKNGVRVFHRMLKHIEENGGL